MIRNAQKITLKNIEDEISIEEKDAICCLIRIVICQNMFLQELDNVKWDSYIERAGQGYACGELDEFSYQADTVFSGLESFMKINQLYKVLANHDASRLAVIRFKDFNSFRYDFKFGWCNITIFI